MGEEIKIASSQDILNRLTDLYAKSDPHDRAVIATICDEVIDRSGTFLGYVREKCLTTN